MKNLRHLCAAVVLTLALTMSASAGNMEAGVADPPSSSADGQMDTGAADGQMTTMVAGQLETGVDGQIETTVTGQITTMNSITSPVDPVTQLALSLLQSVLFLC